MKTKTRTRTLTIAALLIAIGILIPMVSPLKIILEPASFTLASHVATFIAMFISPTVAIAVAIGTAFGFLLGGFPIVISLRAMSHVIFAYFAGNLSANYYDQGLLFSVMGLVGLGTIIHSMVDLELARIVWRAVEKN
ncbi:Niacin transporter NiaX [Jeotgalibaca dankookensis]|uniref:Niacin transporter NiaX n=1 Tax=Jeotgalibaca dankookensis TaxID=708126 RepID=A0A1S6IPR4_9LACT|nr:hypothetical protein [Jeotgalibaca dankookensis]AQS53499.1 Niacin transporter NiaX [Jeotgalibaca dankookensis]